MVETSTAPRHSERGRGVLSDSLREHLFLTRFDKLDSGPTADPPLMRARADQTIYFKAMERVVNEGIGGNYDEIPQGGRKERWNNISERKEEEE